MLTCSFPTLTHTSNSSLLWQIFGFSVINFALHKKIMEAVQSWISEHKLTSIGGLWAAAMGTSLAYSRARTPLKPSLRLIHARMHAQALTLAVLSGAAAFHYFEKRAQENATIAK